ncbi:adenylate/guanylate cyclase domain-containing protein [Candidatus Thiodictyon syntrophicum]|jgi:adenylate cyclase|uniref:Guanylate cyclase n=1 Tax=Candidatus Thiodictyon syntrophicum TaxID=1166950 RepID=A0A2K8UBY3_9GAMM|nr:adenylate/guanylate cyclase domain-containing protein [Candidatus Thiodictyon syntrophicum]AUB83094.1 guanylate cyclase [Candidatus Thiodictyon syntrophicum]
MLHQNRELFLAGVARVVAELCDKSGAAFRHGALRHRLDGLIDEFLLESQPITGTHATIVLADIRGFTALTETLPAVTVIGLLNRYFSVMGRVIKRHGGVIDKFMGDSVMALFGAPERRPDDLLHALACAVEMQHAMVEFNLESVARGEPRLYVGIAVNTGEVMAGSFGSRQHSEYTVIGDTVNVVARMESFSLRGQVLLSESCHAAARDHIEVGAVNEVRVKGKSAPVVLYELHCVNYPRRLVVPQVEVRRSPRVRVDFPVELRRLVGKHIVAEPLSGRALDLGYHGFLVELPFALGRGTDLVVDLAPSLHGESLGDLYAKVVRAQAGADGVQTSLQFTNIDTPAHLQVKRYVDAVLWGR